MKDNIDRHIIVEAATVEQAIDMAAHQLNVSKDRILVKILREEKRGLFGMSGESLARIKASVVLVAEQTV